MSEIKLGKVNTVSVFEQTVSQLRTYIRGGAIEPGERLPPIEELSNELSVGRSSTREALRVLEAEGLVNVKRGLGTFIAPRSNWKGIRNSDVFAFLGDRSEALRQVLEVRERIEALSASLLAANRSTKDIKVLKAILGEMSRIKDKDGGRKSIEKWSELNTDFHLAISEAGGNEIAFEILSHLLPPFSVSNKVIITISGKLAKQHQEHLAILHTIESGDPQEAESVMRGHIRRIMDELNKIIDNES